MLKKPVSSCANESRPIRPDSRRPHSRHGKVLMNGLSSAGKDRRRSSFRMRGRIEKHRSTKPPCFQSTHVQNSSSNPASASASAVCRTFWLAVGCERRITEGPTEIDLSRTQQSWPDETERDVATG